MSIEATTMQEGVPEAERGDGTNPTPGASTQMAQVAGSKAAADKAVFDAALFELRKYVDTAAEGPYLVLHAKAEARACRWAARPQCASLFSIL